MGIILEIAGKVLISLVLGIITFAAGIICGKDEIETSANDLWFYICIISGIGMFIISLCFAFEWIN